MSYNLTIKDKRENLRSSMQKMRLSVMPRQVVNVSRNIHQKLLSHPLLKKSHVIGSYYSFNNEIDTLKVNDKLKKMGHTLALPRIDFSEKGKMDFYTYDDIESLSINKYKIHEPLAILDNYIKPSCFTILLVPLIAFDKYGNRLGMGGGFYDRYLKKISHNCVTIGIAYDFQLLEEIPSEAWDMSLDEVISEKEHYIFHKKY